MSSENFHAPHRLMVDFGLIGPRSAVVCIGSPAKVANQRLHFTAWDPITNTTSQGLRGTTDVPVVIFSTLSDSMYTTLAPLRMSRWQLSNHSWSCSKTCHLSRATNHDFFRRW